MAGTTDSSSTFLHAPLEPSEQVIIKAPKVGWSLPLPQYVCLRALYGLGTSPRIDQEDFATRLQKHGMVRAKADPQVFFGRDGSIFAVHVDDLIYTGPDLEKIRKMISQEFKAKHAGAIEEKWHKFLGRLYRCVEGHYEVMIPASYLMDVITEMGLEGCKAVGTPSVAQPAAVLESPFLGEEAHARYRRVVGKLIWTLQERPDLTQAVASCSRAVQAPTENDMIKLKRIVRYLTGTLEYRLHLKINDDPADRVDVITDASWARRPDRRSVSGIVLVHRGVTFGCWSRVQNG